MDSNRSLRAGAVAFGLMVSGSYAFGEASDFAAIYARESRDNARETVKAYTAAARTGSCQAAKRLGEIYDRGLIGVMRDYGESLKWYHAAHVLGCEIPAVKPGTTQTPPNSRWGAESFQRAAALDAQGKGPEAVDAYVEAARSGNCQAAKRLGEIYDKGLIGIRRDYGESLKWYNFARVLSCDVPMSNVN